MFKRIPGFVLWILLAVSVATLPLACNSDAPDHQDSGAEAGSTISGPVPAAGPSTGGALTGS
jgi:hypothetical protein